MRNREGMKLALLACFWIAASPVAAKQTEAASKAATPKPQPIVPAPIPEGRARVVYLHLAEDARDRTLSTWRTSTLEPQVVELGYGQYGWADVEPGPQGFCARFSGQEPPTKQNLGWNTGLGNLTPGLLSFVVAHRVHAASDAVTTRSERAIAAEPAAGRSALRIMGVWPGTFTISICERGESGESPLVSSLGGSAQLGYGPAGPIHDRPAGSSTLVFHRPSSPQDRCGGLALGSVTVDATAGSRTTLFAFGSVETTGKLRVLACAEPTLRCQELPVRP